MQTVHDTVIPLCTLQGLQIFRLCYEWHTIDGIMSAILSSTIDGINWYKKEATGPLQVKVIWYKIQNIEKQKNVPDSKTKHN